MTSTRTDRSAEVKRFRSRARAASEEARKCEARAEKFRAGGNETGAGFWDNQARVCRATAAGYRGMAKRTEEAGR